MTSSPAGRRRACSSGRYAAVGRPCAAAAAAAAAVAAAAAGSDAAAGGRGRSRRTAPAHCARSV